MKNLERRFPGSAWGLGILFWLLLCCPAWGSAFVTFPSSWDVGQAFALSLSSAVEYRNPLVTWLGRTVSPSAYSPSVFSLKKYPVYIFFRNRYRSDICKKV